MQRLKFDSKYAGQWVAVKNAKVVASGLTLTKLTKKVASRKDASGMRFTLIPKGLIVG